MKENLEDKVIVYLKRNKIAFVPNSVSYRGLRKDFKLITGEMKDMHSIAFAMPSEVEDLLCYIYADAQTNRLEYLITPHILEHINE